MAEASWPRAPRHVPAQTDPVESCQQYAAQNPQITMGPINNHIVSSYFMSHGERSRTKLPSEIYSLPSSSSPSSFFVLQKNNPPTMTKLYLSTLNFVFSLSPNARIWDYINDVVAWPFFHPPFNSLLWADVYKIHNNGTAKGWSWNLNESVWTEYTMKWD